MLNACMIVLSLVGGSKVAVNAGQITFVVPYCASYADTCQGKTESVIWASDKPQNVLCVQNTVDEIVRQINRKCK